ncbi:MAG TPA: hypothetical protein VKT28_14445 [Puia sp.]|nr:hypothetical protein [Puia sp.]
MNSTRLLSANEYRLHCEKWLLIFASATIGINLKGMNIYYSICRPVCYLTFPQKEFINYK